MSVGTGDGDGGQGLVDVEGLVHIYRTDDLEVVAPGTGWRRLAAPRRFAGEAAPGYPVRLDRLLVVGPAHGTLALSDLAADGRVVEAFDASDGWRLWPTAGDTAPVVQDPSAAVARDGRPTLSADVELPGGGLATGRCRSWRRGRSSTC